MTCDAESVTWIFGSEFCNVVIVSSPPALIARLLRGDFFVFEIGPGWISGVTAGGHPPGLRRRRIFPDATGASDRRRFKPGQTWITGREKNQAPGMPAARSFARLARIILRCAAYIVGLSFHEAAFGDGGFKLPQSLRLT